MNTCYGLISGQDLKNIFIYFFTFSRIFECDSHFNGLFSITGVVTKLFKKIRKPKEKTDYLGNGINEFVKIGRSHYCHHEGMNFSW